MKLLRAILLALVLGALSAQALIVKPNVTPVVVSQIANYDQLQGPTRYIDLSSFFSDPDASAAVKLVTPKGTMNFTLDGATTPLTVANFLNYVNSGRYFKVDPADGATVSTFFHRSISNFVIQAGGFLDTITSSSSDTIKPTQVTPFSSIQNEPVISNRRGTIAMAKIDGMPNSATSQWFINLSDNSGGTAALDTQNGGFTVFGRVAGSGMTVADAIAAVPRYNFGSPYDSIPLQNYDNVNPVKRANLITIPTFTEISPLTYSASSSNTNVASVTVSGKNLLVQANQVGTSDITVTATDLDGASVSQIFTVNVITAPGRLLNISARASIGTGDDVLIVGFLVGENSTSKRLAIRGIGPSLQGSIANAINDPTLELRDDANTLLASNDNWGDSPDKQEILDFHLNPTADKESVLIKTIPSSSSFRGYTAIMKGVNSTSGVGVLELYDLDSQTGSTLLNLSSRGHIGAGDSNALFGGIISGGSESRRFVVRSLGPSLAQQNVPGGLADPMLQVIDANGMTVASNNDWQTDPNASEIQTDGLQPGDPKEPALAVTLTPAAYTVKVTGNGANPTGVATVEIYKVQ